MSDRTRAPIFAVEQASDGDLLEIMPVILDARVTSISGADLIQIKAETLIAKVSPDGGTPLSLTTLSAYGRTP